MLGFFNVVQEAWNQHVPTNHNPLGALHIKLSRTVKSLQTSSKTLVPHIKITMTVCREVIHQLHKAQELRHLSNQECDLIKHLKVRILGLAAIQKSRFRQSSRLT
jgi:hypothetical protein